MLKYRKNVEDHRFPHFQHHRKERKITMKKSIAAILILTLILVFVGSAMAVGSRFDIVTSSTSSFMTGCSDITKYNNAWFVRYNEDTSKITPTHRAVVRIHKGTQPITPQMGV